MIVARSLALALGMSAVCGLADLQVRSGRAAQPPGTVQVSDRLAFQRRLIPEPWLLSQTLSLADEYDKAVALYEQGDLQGSIKSFSRILTARSVDRDLRNASFLGRAKMYLAISQPMLALGDLKKIEYRKPTPQQEGELNLLMGVTSIQLKLYQQSLLYFRKAESVLPPSALLYSNRGVAYQALGDLTRAKRDFKLSLSLKKALPTQYNLAVLEKDSKNYAECVRLLNAIAISSKATPAVFQQRGICYARLGAADKAIRDLLKALAADGANPITLEELALIMSAKGNKEAALKYLELASSIQLQRGDANEYSRLLELMENLRR